MSNQTPGALAVCVSALWRPDHAFGWLLRMQDRRRGFLGGMTVTGLGLLYTLTVAGLHKGGAEPVVKPVLPIRNDRYYLWLCFLTVPTFVATWLVFSRTAHTAAHALGGRCDPVQTRDLCGLAIALPTLVTMWVPESAMALLLIGKQVTWEAMRAWGERWPGNVIHTSRQIVGVFWMMGLATAALRQIHGLSWPRAALASMAGLAPAGAIVGFIIR